MEEEIKKAYLSWSEKGVCYLNSMHAYDTLTEVNQALQRCDEILEEAALGIGYVSRQSDIDRLLDGRVTLRSYIDALNYYVDDKLDQPLRQDFKKNATETISRIHLEDFEIDNTLGLTENNYIPGGMGYPGTMTEQEKGKLTFADFIGTSDGKAEGNGFHMAFTNGSVEGFAEIFAGQYEAMLASGMLGEDNELTQQEFLEQFYKQGEFVHDSSNPFLNFVSSVLDITIIKPIIEACTGEDLITGEDLTDLERGLKVVFAVVDLVTLGAAISATKISEMGLEKSLQAFGKTALIDFAGNTMACGVGALGEAFDWPVPITIMLSLASGITVSVIGNKMLFKNAEGVVIREKVLDEEQVKIIGENLEGGLKIVDTGDLKVIEIKTPEVANREWLARGYDKPPYNSDFEVKVVQAGNEEYVRVFSYNSDGTSNKLGGWLMKKSDIEGLTPAQIADKYALPKEPTHICDIKLNPDFNLQTGIANPVEGWGNGGGQQFDTMGKFIDEDAFVNERLIGE